MRVSLVQMSVHDGDVARNVSRAEQLIRNVVADDSPELVLLPEMWTSGFVGEQWAEIADNETPNAIAKIESLCAELGVSIGGSMITRREDGNLVNRFSIITPEAESVFYDKIHLFSPMQEHDYLVRGDELVHFAVGDESPEDEDESYIEDLYSNAYASLSICYDLRFPAMYRTSAHEGAGVFLVVSAWPEPRCDALRLLAKARAVENQAFLVLCNRVGPASEGGDFCGGSMVVSPIGDILLDLGDNEGVGTVTFNERESPALKSLFNVLKDDISGIDTPL